MIFFLISYTSVLIKKRRVLAHLFINPFFGHSFMFFLNDIHEKISQIKKIRGCSDARALKVKIFKRELPNEPVGFTQRL